jgi:hypothetical protein
MKIELTWRQKQIVKSLKSKSSKDLEARLNDLGDGFLVVEYAEDICNLINEEFMMRGVLPSFEPNAYGYELETLIDVVNNARLRTPRPASNTPVQ